MSKNETLPNEIDGYERPWRQESVLQKLFIEQDHTAYRIGQLLDCSVATVTRWLRRHDIEYTTQETYPKLRDAEWLERLYREEKQSTHDIADKIGCTAANVGKWLRKHDIEIRSDGVYLPDEVRDESHLREMYHEQSMTIVDMADELGCCAETVRDWMKKHGIESRDAKFKPGEDHPWWTGGHEKYYGPNWEQQKRKAMQRDGHECKLCPTTLEEHLDEFGERLHVHHIKKFRKFDDYKIANRLENLATVCSDCHYEVEKMSPLFPQPTN